MPILKNYATTLIVFFLLTIIISHSCQYNTILPPVDCEENAPEINITSIQSTPCGESKGSIEILATSANDGEFTYSLDGESFQESNIFTNLSAQSYQVYAKENGNCTTSIEAIVPDESGISLEIEVTNTDCGSSTGSIMVKASLSNVEFSIDEKIFQPTGSFSKLGQGIYNVQVREINSSCGTSKEVLIPSGVSYNNSVKNIIDTNCAISGCHVAGRNIPDFKEFSNVQKNVATIKLRINNGTMPPGNRAITSKDIQLITCWVDDGALEN
ncbi:MAG: hypothetical protein KTR26_17900 [Flammeovirgaceae bacterium]|nr:hypothetical protein [Flammeovirgaceae bacterium]